jgi:hypothetical protein
MSDSLERPAVKPSPGDVITYKPATDGWPEPHRARVVGIPQDGILVSELPPGPEGLVHLISWDRLIGLA